MSKAIDKLTDDEVLALYKLIQREGRVWRGVLDYAWSYGRWPAYADRPTLQKLHNRDGGALLVAKLKRQEIVAAGQQVEKAYTEAPT